MSVQLRLRERGHGGPRGTKISLRDCQFAGGGLDLTWIGELGGGLEEVSFVGVVFRGMKFGRPELEMLLAGRTGCVELRQCSMCGCPCPVREDGTHDHDDSVPEQLVACVLST
jgi:hypothetical protein